MTIKIRDLSVVVLCLGGFEHAMSTGTGGQDGRADAAAAPNLRAEPTEFPKCERYAVIEAEPGRAQALSVLPGQRSYDTCLTRNFSVSLESRDSVVRITGSERHPSTAEWFQWVREEPTEYARVRVHARHCNEFYVLGESSDGLVSLERWEWPRILGAYCTDFAPTCAPLGIPVAPALTIVEIEGGSYLPPAARSPSPIVRKSLLYGPAALGRVLSATVEPEGRFLLLHRRDTAGGEHFLTQLPLCPVGMPVDILSSQQAPVLNQLDGGFGVGNFGRLGRIYHKGITPNVLYLRDSTGDGVLETWGAVDHLSFEAHFPEYGWTLEY